MDRVILLLAASLAVLMLSASQAAALGLEYYGIEDDIQPDMSIKNTITLVFTSPISHLEYQLGMKVRNLTATSSFDSADCRVEDAGENSNVVCDFVGMTEEKNLLKLNFETKEGIRKIDDKYKFTVNYGVSLPTERLFVIIKLPENSILSEEPVNASFFPSSGKTLSDGKRIGVYWESTNITTSSDLQYSVMYSVPIAISSSLIIALTAIVIVAMVGVGFYVRKGSAAQQQPVITATPAVSVLNHDEKTVVDILKRFEGKIGQKSIVREGDFSKAKVSRLVKSLKERGVVDVEPISGRENRIILKLREQEPAPQADGAAAQPVAEAANKSPETN